MKIQQNGIPIKIFRACRSIPRGESAIHNNPPKLNDTHNSPIHRYNLLTELKLGHITKFNFPILFRYSFCKVKKLAIDAIRDSIWTISYYVSDKSFYLS